MQVVMIFSATFIKLLTRVILLLYIHKLAKQHGDLQISNLNIRGYVSPEGRQMLPHVIHYNSADIQSLPISQLLHK